MLPCTLYDISPTDAIYRSVYIKADDHARVAHAHIETGDEAMAYALEHDDTALDRIIQGLRDAYDEITSLVERREAIFITDYATDYWVRTFVLFRDELVETG